MSRYNPSDELGRSGLNRYDGFIDEEFQRELKGERRIKIYKEMGTYPVIAGVLFAMTNIIGQVKFRIDPSDDTKEAKDASDFVESCRHDMSHSWNETISDHLSFLKYGFNYSEIVYKRRRGPYNIKGKYRSKFNDNKIGWRKIASRAQETLIDNWLFDDEGGIQGVVQRNAPPDFKEVTIPIEKALLFRTSIHKNNPESESVLRNAYTSHFFAKNIINIEAIGIERDLVGLGVMRIPSDIINATSGDKFKAHQAYKKLVRDIRRDEQDGLVLPSDKDAQGNYLYDFTLLTSGGTRNFDTSKIIRRHDQNMALSVLADFLVLGLASQGSFALAKEKTSLFNTALTNFVDHIVEIYNRHAIPRLMQMNGYDLRDQPSLVHGGVKSVDLKVIGDYINRLSTSGMDLFPNDSLEEHLLKAANFPIEA